MKLFVLATMSESGDQYQYRIKHPEKPTGKELKAFLIKNSSDKDETDHILYEHVESVTEIDAEESFEIPELSDKVLKKWHTAGGADEDV